MPCQIQRPDFSEYFSGNKVLPGARPAAHCYCGHQFGNFSGQLGDGATMYLGEVRRSATHRSCMAQGQAERGTSTSEAVALGCVGSTQQRAPMQTTRRSLTHDRHVVMMTDVARLRWSAKQHSVYAV